MNNILKLKDGEDYIIMLSEIADEYNDIKNNFGFTVNVGIGDNKLLAKMASDFSKPDKVHTLYKDEIQKHQEKLSFYKKAKKEFVDEAVRKLSLALDTHNRLEEYYIKATDFDVIDKLTKQLVVGK